MADGTSNALASGVGVGMASEVDVLGSFPSTPETSRRMLPPLAREPVGCGAVPTAPSPAWADSNAKLAAAHSSIGIRSGRSMARIDAPGDARGERAQGQ